MIKTKLEREMTVAISSGCLTSVGMEDCLTTLTQT